MKHPFLLSILLVAGTGSAFSESIFVSPASQNVSVSQSFTVGIDIDNIPNVYDYQFSLAFNPKVLAAQSVTEGALFANTHDSSFSPGTIDNSTGTITLVFDTLLTSVVGVAGPGTLATVDFRAVGTSISSIDFSPIGDLILQDSSGNTLTVTPISGSVAVTPTPEPATFYLLVPGVGLILFGVLRRSRLHLCFQTAFNPGAPAGTQEPPTSAAVPLAAAAD